MISEMLMARTHLRLVGKHLQVTTGVENLRLKGPAALYFFMPCTSLGFGSSWINLLTVDVTRHRDEPRKPRLLLFSSTRDTCTQSRS